MTAKQMMQWMPKEEWGGLNDTYAGLGQMLGTQWTKKGRELLEVAEGLGVDETILMLKDLYQRKKG